MGEREQVQVPRPRTRQGRRPDDDRARLATSLKAGYRRNVVRVQIQGGPIDIVPIDSGAPDLAAPVEYRDLADDARAPLHVVGASHGWNQGSTPLQDAWATDDLHRVLEERGWRWEPAVVFAPGREWCQTAAAVRGVPLQEVLDLARARGQEAVLTWCDGLLVATPTGLAPDLSRPVAVQARLQQPALGCPMRFGEVDRVCVRDGGPFTSSSMQAALVWEHHRAMLVAALGCSLCAGGDVTGAGRPYGITDMLTPSRRRGWGWGAVRETLVDPTQAVAHFAGRQDHPAGEGR